MHMRRATATFVMLIAVMLASGLQVGQSSADDATSGAAAISKPKAVIVVRPAAWSTALKNWKEYRTGQGHEVFELDAELGKAGIQSAIIEMTKAAKKAAGNFATSQSDRLCVIDWRQRSRYRPGAGTTCLVSSLHSDGEIGWR